MISPPVLVEPVNATLSTPECCTRYEPVVGPSPGTTLTTPGGKPTSDRELREAKRRQRRLRIGLEHDRAAGRERGRELPGRHQERVVPRDDLRAHADRLLERVEEERAADGIRAAGDRRRPRTRRSGSARRRRRSPPSPTRSPCRRCAPRARRAPCGSRRSRLRARGAAASARSAASSPTAPRAPRARRRRRGRRRPRSPSPRARAARPLAGSSQLPKLTRGRLARLAADEEPVLPLDRDGHRGNPNRASGLLRPGSRVGSFRDRTRPSRGSSDPRSRPPARDARRSTACRPAGSARSRSRSRSTTTTRATTSSRRSRTS